jgi:hypothetical protein
VELLLGLGWALLFPPGGSGGPLAARFDDHSLGAAMREILLDPALFDNRARHAQGAP